MNSCPSCGAILTSSDPLQSGKQRLLCNITNEGGFQEDIDILPDLSEEGYLRAYPEEQKARAFIAFCRQGDLDAVFGVLQVEDDDDLAPDVLRYQDQLNNMQSTLHAAIIGGNESVAWLLLYLASDLSTDQFPTNLLQEARSMGLQRGDDTGKADVRSLKDLDGRFAEHIASQMEGTWANWIGNARLAL